MSDRQSTKRPYLIGVTGNIACGKSTVMGELARLGAVTIDADEVYHQLIEPGTPLWQRIVGAFGNGIVASDGRIDRRTLGSIVFNDAASLELLERLTHPAIRTEIRTQIARHDSGIVAVDAVKLIEGGMHEDCDSVWIVTCRRDQQIERLIARNGLTHEEAEQRVVAQPPIEPKLAIADVEIDNSGERDSTIAQVSEAWRRLDLERHAGAGGIGSRTDALTSEAGERSTSP